MGSAVNKTLLELDGRPILHHTLARLARVSAISEVVVVVNAADEELLTGRHRAALDALGATRVIVGGPRRQDSVFIGLAATRAGESDLVLIHDGVRPFVKAGVVERVIDRAHATGAAIAAMPADFTIKECAGSVVTRTVPRDALWQAQTPQVFRKALLVRAFEYANHEEIDVTDDAQLLELVGIPVEVVPGNRANIKITTPDDLELARALAGLSS